MSLVNDMLRDLDRRRQLNNEAISGTTLSPALPSASQTDLMRLLIFSMAALIIAVLSILWLWPGLFLPGDQEVMTHAIIDSEPGSSMDDSITTFKSQNTSKLISNEQETTYRNSSTFQNTSHVKKTFSVNLEELSIKETEHGLRLQFYLNDVIKQEVNMDERMLRIYLPNTELNNVLPPLAAHSLINQADIIKRDAGLELTLHLAKDLQVQDYVTKLDNRVNVVVDLLVREQLLASSAEKNSAQKNENDIITQNSIPATGNEQNQNPELKYNQMAANKFVTENLDANTPLSTIVLKSSKAISLRDKDIKKRLQSLRLIKIGQREQAVENLQRFIYQNPAAHNCRELLVTLLLTDEQIALAESILMEGISRQASRSAYRKLLSRVLMQRDQYQQALELLTKNPPSVNKDSEYYALMAVLYQKQNLHKKTVNVYQQLLQLDNSQGSWWVGMGISYDALGSDEYARNAYRRALRLPKLSKELRQYAMGRLQSQTNIK